ncbi:MAG: hypothetical protein ABSA57_08090 [Candidatus Acidiferrales bacterium]|jgi:hypothetical protein
MMPDNIKEVIEEKAKRVDRLREELEICKLVIQSKMNEVIQIEEEILLLQELLVNQ